jgi:hypothetical protein
MRTLNVKPKMRNITILSMKGVSYVISNFLFFFQGLKILIPKRKIL